MADMIPSSVDGLKEIERLAVSVALEQYSDKEDIDVVLLAVGTYAANKVYTSGTREAVIVRLAQNFVGTNNINLFEPVGNVGNRYQGTSAFEVDTTGLAVRISPITRLIFRQEDDAVAMSALEGCEACRQPPHWLLPVIPFILVNGCDGKGPWLKSSIPKYKPEDIIANVRRRMEDKALVPMTPWYKGFKGKIEMSATDSKQFIISGVVAQIDDKQRRVTITELPIGSWTSEYINWLQEQKWVKCSRDLSDCKGTIQLEVTLLDDAWLADEDYLIKKLELTKTISLSDMHVIHQCGEVDKYEDPVHIIMDFVDYRVAFYHKRKVLLLAKEKSELMSIMTDMTTAAGASRHCCNVINHWMPKVEHFPEEAAVKLSDMLSTLSKERKFINEGDINMKDMEEVVAKLFERIGGVNKAKGKRGKKHSLGEDDLTAVQTICNAVQKLQVAVAQVEQLSVTRDYVQKRIDQLQKEDILSLWSKDLDELELFLKERHGKKEEAIEEAQSKTKKSNPTNSRGLKRKTRVSR